MCSWCMRNLTNEQKLAGFPTVNYISLRESVERREYMEWQFAKYGIKSNPYLVDRYDEIKDTIKIRTPENINEMVSSLQIGAITSHIQMLRKWLTETNESYAIFCDDDINFGSIDYWDFTWIEFYSSLPADCSVLQLIRMDHEVTPEKVAQVDGLRIKYGRWWGAAWLMKRDYVQHLVKLLYNEDDGSYNLTSMNGGYQPILENVMLLNYFMVYNFPLLTEANETHGPTWLFFQNEEEHKGADWSYRNRRVYCRLIEHYWENTGLNLNIHEALRI